MLERPGGGERGGVRKRQRDKYTVTAGVGEARARGKVRRGRNFVYAERAYPRGDTR